MVLHCLLLRMRSIPWLNVLILNKVQEELSKARFHINNSMHRWSIAQETAVMRVSQERGTDFLIVLYPSLCLQTWLLSSFAFVLMHQSYRVALPIVLDFLTEIMLNIEVDSFLKWLSNIHTPWYSCPWVIPSFFFLFPSYFSVYFLKTRSFFYIITI